jgi:hypothetical protein
MVAQLPFPYPDELLYSVYARHFAYFPPDSLSGSMREVVGKRWCSFRFGRDIERLARRTHYAWGMDSHEIIERHTLLPYHGAFYEPSEYLSWVRAFCSSYDRSNFFGSSIARFQHHGAKRYCPRCVSEDLSEFGETYWRRSHQLFGATICTVHNQILFDCDAGGRDEKSAIYDATRTILSSGGSECASFAEDEFRLAAEISKRCVAVLNGNCNKWTKCATGPNYIEVAKELGFSYGSVKTDLNLLLARFRGYFGAALLEKIGFEAEYGGRHPFRKHGSKSPLTNVLVQMFLEEHLERRGFAGFPIGRSVYGWKCPNEKHPDEFRMPRVKRVKSRLGFDYFTAHCSCGMDFSFYAASADDPLMPEIKNVRWWSLARYEEAHRLFKRYLSVGAVAHAMNVSYRTASKLITGANSASQPTPEKIKELRADWKQRHSRATYQALLKHDRRWLHEQRKHDQRVVVELPIPPAHDDILAAKIRDAVRRVRSAGSNLNLTAISTEIGFRIVRTHLEEYPLSKAEVLAVCPIVPRAAKGGHPKKAARSNLRTEGLSKALQSQTKAKLLKS